MAGCWPCASGWAWRPSGSTADGVDWQAVTGPAGHLGEELARYAALGVDDLSLLPGQDDRSSRETVDTLVGEVLPALRAEGIVT